MKFVTFICSLFFIVACSGQKIDESKIDVNEQEKYNISTLPLEISHILLERFLDVQKIQQTTSKNSIIASVELERGTLSRVILDVNDLSIVEKHKVLLANCNHGSSVFAYDKELGYLINDSEAVCNAFSNEILWKNKTQYSSYLLPLKKNDDIFFVTNGEHVTILDKFGNKLIQQATGVNSEKFGLTQTMNIVSGADGTGYLISTTDKPTKYSLSTFDINKRVIKNFQLPYGYDVYPVNWLNNLHFVTESNTGFLILSEDGEIKQRLDNLNAPFPVLGQPLRVITVQLVAGGKEYLVISTSSNPSGNSTWGSMVWMFDTKGILVWSRFFDSRITGLFSIKNGNQGESIIVANLNGLYRLKQVVGRQ